jgi:tellurite resistance protein
MGLLAQALLLRARKRGYPGEGNQSSFNPLAKASYQGMVEEIVLIDDSQRADAAPKDEQKRSEVMDKQAIIFTEAEAALMLVTLVAFADDNPSPEEGVLLRKYFLLETAESVQKKLTEAGYNYPDDLTDVEQYFLPVLQNAQKSFQLRTMAVALQIADADGETDFDEIAMLNRYSFALALSLGEAEKYARESLREIDERRDYDNSLPAGEEKGNILLTLEEAGVALAALVGFADDDPSEKEIGVIRNQFNMEVVLNLPTKMEQYGYQYPDDLPLLRDKIQETLGKAGRDFQLKILGIAYKVASADGVLDPRELELIKGFCEEFLIGFREVKEYFMATPENEY